MKLTDFLREVLAFVVPGVALLLLLPAGMIGDLAQSYPRPAFLPELPVVDAVMLFFVGYVLGAMLSGIGSTLDDLAEKLGGGDAILSFVPGVRASRAKSRSEFENLKDLAKRLEVHMLKKLPEEATGPAYGYRAFWWNFLRTHHPRAAAEVDRLEAQQKMFRSLTIAALALAVIYLVPISSKNVAMDPWAALAFAAAAIGSFIYYSSVRQTTSRRLLQLAVVQLLPPNLVDET